MPNRITLSPMCQYSSSNGESNDWHLIHLGSHAIGGAGLIFTETVHVQSEGRITPHCLGLWNDDQVTGLARIAAFISAQGSVPGIQLGHAGRKASSGRPWEGSGPLSEANGGWKPMGPSPEPYAAGWPIPFEMDQAAIDESIEAFVKAASRADRAGFRVIQIHAGHGYLHNQFLSPLANHRTDEYGGSFENRIRFLLQTLAAIRSELHEDLPIFVRVSATDWVDGGWTVDDTSRLALVLRERGLAELIDCSSGGVDPRQQVITYPGYQVPFASRVRADAQIPTGAVGMITSPELAEHILAEGDADLIFLGRALLADPLWPRKAAKQFGAPEPWPVQYERANIF